MPRKHRLDAELRDILVRTLDRKQEGTIGDVQYSVQRPERADVFFVRMVIPRLHELYLLWSKIDEGGR